MYSGLIEVREEMLGTQCCVYRHTQSMVWGRGWVVVMRRMVGFGVIVVIRVGCFVWMRVRTLVVVGIGVFMVVWWGFMVVLLVRWLVGVVWFMI